MQHFYCRWILKTQNLKRNVFTGVWLTLYHLRCHRGPLNNTLFNQAMYAIIGIAMNSYTEKKQLFVSALDLKTRYHFTLVKCCTLVQNGISL